MTPSAPSVADVLIVSLGSTAGLRAADEELLGSLRRAGAEAELVHVPPPAPVRTLMLTDLRWALAARRAVVASLERRQARAIVYSSTTAALLWPRPCAIRFDAPSSGNRPGRHGLWQRPLERRRLRQSLLLLPWSEGAMEEVPAAVRSSRSTSRALVVPVAIDSHVPVDPGARDGPALPDESPVPIRPSASVDPASSLSSARDIAAVTYAANPRKKGLGTVLDAWRRVRAPGEELVVTGIDEGELSSLGYDLRIPGVRVSGALERADYRALLRRARVYLCAPLREDHGLAQLEALAEGCALVTTPAPGPYAALSLARRLDGRLVSEDLGAALRTALDDPQADYSRRASVALAPLRREAVDRLVAEELLPRLLPRD